MKTMQLKNYDDDFIYNELSFTPLKKNEVIIQLDYAGINPVDSYIKTGNYAYYQPTLPATLGFDGSGKVIKTHPDSKFKIGDEVYLLPILQQTSSGSFASHIKVDEDQVFKVPKHLNTKLAAGLGLNAQAAYHALFNKGAFQANQTVLVHGASGGVGNLVVQMIKAQGGKVIATVGSQKTRNSLKELKVEHIFSHYDPDYKHKIMNLNEKIDLIIEMAAHHNLNDDLDLIKPSGKIVVLGNQGKIDFDPRKMMSKEAYLTGMVIFNLSEEELKVLNKELHQFIEVNEIVPLIDQEFHLKELNQAFDAMKERQAHGKIIINTKI